MKSYVAWTVSAVLILAIGGCSQFFEAGGSKNFLTTEVNFVDVHQMPIVGAKVYVIETIGTMHLITEVRQTNEHGQILLSGPYCLPIIVAAQGGNFVIRSDAVASSYKIAIDRNDHTPLEQLFGKPEDPYLNYTRRHNSCG